MNNEEKDTERTAENAVSKDTSDENTVQMSENAEPREINDTEKSTGEAPVKKRENLLFSGKFIMTVFALVAVCAALTFVYSYLTHPNERALSLQTFWLTQSPVAGGGCVSKDNPTASAGAIDEAINLGYIIRLNVYLTEGRVMVKSTEPYELGTALTQISGSTGLILELDGGAELAEKVYSACDGYKGNLAVQSSDITALKWYSDNAPHIIIGLKTGELEGAEMSSVDKFLHRNMLKNYVVRPYYIACEYKNTDSFPIKMIRKNTVVIAEGISDPNLVRTAFEYADNVCIEGFVLDDAA